MHGAAMKIVGQDLYEINSSALDRAATGTGQLYLSNVIYYRETINCYKV